MYASGPQKKVIDGVRAEIIKNVFLDKSLQAHKKMMNWKDCATLAKDFVFEAMEKQFSELTGAQGCILKDSSPEGLLAFTMAKFSKELQDRVPMVWELIKLLSTSKRQKRRLKSNQESPVNISLCGTVAAMLLKSRHPEMSALAYRNGLIIRHSGAGTLALTSLNKVGISMTPRSLSSKALELGKGHDKVLQAWKKDLESSYKVAKAVDKIRDKLSAVQYLPEMPKVKDAVDLVAKLGEHVENGVTVCKDMDKQNENLGTMSSADLMSLNLSWLSTPENVLESICDSIKEEGMEESTLLLGLKSVSKHNDVSAPLVDACQATEKYLKSKIPTGYQIIGDNLDLHVNAKHMTTANKNKSLHNFNMLAMADDVSGNHLSDTHERLLSEVPIAEFLPSAENTANLKSDLIPLWSRVVVRQLDHFSLFRNSVIYHIPHQYSEKMKECSKEVPLGTLPKNENLNEDMVDILETIQEQFIPWNGDEPADFVFLGGDQLTEERARNLQKARLDGLDVSSRLQAVWPKNEDWHGIRIAYSVALKILNKPNSVGDWGTHASNAIVSGNNNALKDPLDNFSDVKEFFNIELDAFIVAATMEYFGMSSVSSTPSIHKIPTDVKKGDTNTKRKWLHQHISKMLDIFVMDGFCEIQELVEGEPPPQRQPRPELPCAFPGCPRVFKYPACKVKHEEKIHGIVQPESASSKNKSKKKDQQKETKNTKKDKKEAVDDYVYNYGCLHLTLGLLLRNADDSVKEGDGERLMRVWKYLTLLFRLKGNNKYALAGLRLTASRAALLTPRQGHRLTWNRFAGTRTGRGQRISRDLRLEHVNKTSKMVIRSLGFPNVNNQSIQKATRATGSVEKLQQQSNADFGITQKDGHHSNKHNALTFSAVLDQVVRRGHVFSFSPGREYAAFPKLQRTLFGSMNTKSLHRWIKKHRKKWHRQNRYVYRFQ